MLKKALTLEKSALPFFLLGVRIPESKIPKITRLEMK